MNHARQVAIPTLVRIKPQALQRVGLYLSRYGFDRVAVLSSAGLPTPLTEDLRRGFRSHDIACHAWMEIQDNGFEQVSDLAAGLPSVSKAVVGLGGGKALDVAKYVAFSAKLPYLAAPTSLSNDGFASPQASMTVASKRRSLRAAMPFGVVVDTAVCAQAPRILSLSGVGDLAAKFTAVYDWKLAFHRTGELVDDFAALLSDWAVHAFLARPMLDAEGIEALAASLMFNGVAMEVCGSSRPASGSEHLISHALDEISSRPRLHGLQVGVATYLVSLLQGQKSESIARLFEATGFWRAVAADPFSATEWLQAVKHAPHIKENFFTILSTRDVTAEVTTALQSDPWLSRCFRD